MASADKLQDQLAYPPRAMRADRAAAYLAMVTSTFLELVKEGLLPKGVKVRGMRVWDRYELDGAFDELKAKSNAERCNPFEVRFGITDKA
jgi:predicted DNA-binding transcriptional regulator AlpA